MKVLKTNRLFYRKYPYKVECSVKGAEYVKRHGLPEVLKFCDPTYNAPRFFLYRDFTPKQKIILADFAKEVEPLMKEGHQIRVEMNTMNFYLDDRDTYEKIHKKLAPWVKSITEPASDEELLQLNSKNHLVMCNKLPHNKYGYKVIIKNNLPEDQREKFVDWLQNYGDAFRVARGTEIWLRGYRYWCHDPYMYVESSKHLTMLGLYLGDKIKRTYEFVLRDTQINNVSEDELEVCQP